MGDEVYQELPAEGELYEELNMENPQVTVKNVQMTNGPPPVPVTNRPLPQAPSLPERNPAIPQRELPTAPAPAPPIPAKASKSTFFDQQTASPAKRPAAALPPVPTVPAPRGGEDLRVSQAFQTFIQSNKTGSTKARYSTPWAKRPDPCGQEIEFITLQGIDSRIPFVPPSILVKMPLATEVATGNYLRLFIPPASSSQQPPQRATAGIQLPHSNGTDAETPELLYDDAVNETAPQETYDDVVQKPPALSPVSEDTYDDVTIRQEDTYDDVLQKPSKNSSVSEDLVYDDVELSRNSNRNSPTPSGSSEVSGKGKVDKKSQKLETQRVKKREKSVKHFKLLNVKMSDPYLQDLVAICASEKSKDKDMLQIAEGERVQLVVRQHAKLKQGLWVVEKADGTMGLVVSSLFAEGEDEVYETC